jgi:hypothetical protein
MDTKYVIFKTNKRSRRIATKNRAWFKIIYMLAVIHGKLFPLKPVLDSDFPEDTSLNSTEITPPSPR